MIFLDISGFQRFWPSRSANSNLNRPSKSQAGTGVEAFIDLFFVQVPLVVTLTPTSQKSDRLETKVNRVGADTVRPNDM